MARGRRAASQCPHGRGRDAVLARRGTCGTGACDRDQVEARRQLVDEVLLDAGQALGDAGLQRLRRAASAAPGTAASSARPTSPAPSSTCSRASSGVSGCGTRCGDHLGGQLRRCQLGGQLGERAPARAEGGDDVRVGVGLDRGHGGHERDARARGPEHRGRASAASPPEDHPSSAARSMPSSSSERGEAVAERVRVPRSGRCRRRRAGRPRAAGRRSARGEPSSGWRASRESGVPCRYTTGYAVGIADVVDARAPVGQPIRRATSALGALDTLPELARPSTRGGSRVQLFSSEKIRNVALVGHGGAGKTTLAEALLHRAGAINRLGRVEDGTTVCDHEPEEQTRGLSLSLAVAPFEWKGHKVNLVDTPGYADFMGDVVAALRVVDLAVFVVSAVDGVEVQTEAIWREASRLGVPRMIFVNKLDRERASFERTLDELRDRLGAGVAPLELPIGAEADFRGIADLLTDTAHVYEGGVPHTEPIPDDMEALEHQVHDNLVEGIVVAEDALLERYLEGDIPSVAELEHALTLGIETASVFPVVCGSATTEVGIDRLADLLVEIGPPPADRPVDRHRRRHRGRGDAPIPTPSRSAFAFKTIADPFVGQLTLFKVLSGTIRNDDHLVNSRSGTEERLHGLFVVRGKEHEPVDALAAGDLGGVAKLSRHPHRRHAGPARQRPCRCRPIEQPPPVLATAVVPEDAGRRRQAGHRAAPPPGGGPGPPRRARRGDAPDPPLGHGRHPPRHRRRAARAEVRREGHHRAGADPLPRDDHRAGRAARVHAQEAVRRPRPVRAGRDLASSRSSGARGSSSWTRSSAAPSARATSPRWRKGVEEAMAARRPERPPGGRRAGHARRRQGAQRRQQRDGLPHRGPRGLPGGDGQGRAGRARADLAARRHRARPSCWAT